MNKNSIQELMTCKYDGCNKIFKDPVELECKITICMEHIDENLSTMDCKFCNKTHSIDNIHENTTMKGLLAINAHLNDEQLVFLNEFKKSIEEMESARSELKNLSNKPDDYLNSIIDSLKEEIKVHYDEVISRSARFYKKYLDELDLLQKKFQKDLKKRIKSLNIEKTLENESSVCSKYDELFRNKFNKEKVNSSIEEIKESTKNLRKHLNLYESVILMNKKITFQAKNFDRENFGKIDIQDDQEKVEESDELIENDNMQSMASFESVINNNDSLNSGTSVKRKSCELPNFDELLQTSKRNRIRTTITTPGKVDGIKFGEISYIKKAFEQEINDKNVEILYNICISNDNECKDKQLMIKKLNEFNGFSFKVGSNDYEVKITKLKELKSNDFESLSKFLRLPFINNKDKLAERIIDYLMCPKELNLNSLTGHKIIRTQNIKKKEIRANRFVKLNDEDEVINLV